MLIAISITEFLVCLFIYKKFNFPIALIFLFLFLIFDILWFKQFDDFKRHHLDTITLLATIVTTFLGVYLAIIFTNSQTEKDNKKKVIQLLLAANSELYQSRTSLNRMANEAEQYYYGLEDSQFKKKLKKNRGSIATFRRPEIIDFVLHNELGLSYLPAETIITLTSINMAVNEIYSRVNFAKVRKRESSIASFQHLVLINDILTQVLNLTVSLIKEEIDIKKWKSEVGDKMKSSSAFFIIQ